MKYAIILICCFFFPSCEKDRIPTRAVRQITGAGENNQLNEIYFISSQIGFVVGGNRFENSIILKTTNGGLTWSAQMPDAASKTLYSITQSPSGHMFTIGFDGKLLRSADTGKSWIFRQIWFLPYKDLIYFTPDQGVAIAGISFDKGFRTALSSHGDPQPFDSVGFELNDIEKIDQNTALIAGYGVLLKTMNSGQTWRILPVQNDNFTAVCQAKDGTIWVCGYNGTILKSEDMGEHWSVLRNGNNITLPRYRLLDISFRDAQYGFAVGEKGLLIYTDDGGEHWMEFDRFTSQTLRSIWIHDDQSIFVCGDQGAFFQFSVPELFSW